MLDMTAVSAKGTKTACRERSAMSSAKPGTNHRAALDRASAPQAPSGALAYAREEHACKEGRHGEAEHEDSHRHGRLALVRSELGADAVEHGLGRVHQAVDADGDEQQAGVGPVDALHVRMGMRWHGLQPCWGRGGAPRPEASGQDSRAARGAIGRHYREKAQGCQCCTALAALCSRRRQARFRLFLLKACMVYKKASGAGVLHAGATHLLRSGT